MPSNRVTYLRKKSYNTRSNKIRKLRLPGGRLSIQYTGKTAKGPQTASQTRSRLSGLSRLRNPQYATLSKTKRSISRPYGGVLTPSEVKDKIMRAFLIEEVKIVKQLVKAEPKQKAPKEAKAAGDKNKANKKAAPQNKKAAPKK